MSKRIRIITPGERTGPLLPDEQRALAARGMMATGPHLPEPESEVRHRALMKMYAEEEDRERAANGGETPRFATGRFGSVPVPAREIDDAPDAAHSPELVDEQPDYSVTELLADMYGLDEHGNPKPPEQITPDQMQARANRYAEEPIADVTLPESVARAPYTPPTPTTNRVQVAGD